MLAIALGLLLGTSPLASSLESAPPTCNVESAPLTCNVQSAPVTCNLESALQIRECPSDLPFGKWPTDLQGVVVVNLKSSSPSGCHSCCRGNSRCLGDSAHASIASVINHVDCLIIFAVLLGVHELAVCKLSEVLSLQGGLSGINCNTFS